MNLITTKGTYGLIALYEISKGTSKEPVSIADISLSSGVSKNYLEQLLRSLRTAKIVISTKGREGGYYLSRPLSEISYYEVFVALEGELKLTCVDMKPVYSMLFEGFDKELKELLSKPLSEFNKNADKYLNYAI